MLQITFQRVYVPFINFLPHPYEFSDVIVILPTNETGKNCDCSDSVRSSKPCPLTSAGPRTRKDSTLKIMRDLLCKPLALSAFIPILILSLGVAQGARCYAQTQSQPNDAPKVAALRELLPTDTAATTRAAAAPDPASETSAWLHPDL